MRVGKVLGTVFLIIILVIAVVFLLEYFEVTDFVSSPPAPRATESPRLDTSTAMPSASAVPTEEPTPVPTAEPTPSPSPSPRPYPDVPQQAQPAPEGYFEDAVFIGNSLVDGLDLYWYNGNLNGATFYTGTSLTIFDVGPYLNEMADDDVGKVYVGLGMNEIDYNKQVLRGEFENLIETVRGYNPDVIIYFMSVTPVSRWKDQNNTLHTKASVEEFNSFLKRIANDNDCYFMDLIPVLADEEGYLPSEVTNDGVHFLQDYYVRWFDYLENNYVLPVPAAQGDAPAELPVTAAPESSDGSN